MSQTTVDQIINSHLKKIKSKKKRKKLQKELILVGIHVRYELKKYKSKIIPTKVAVGLVEITAFRLERIFQTLRALQFITGQGFITRPILKSYRRQPPKS